MIKLLASREILDRAFGKPSQAPKHTVGFTNYDFDRLDDNQIDQLHRLLIEATPVDAVGNTD